MAAIPLIIAGVGAGISAIGQWKAGTAAKEAGQAQQAASEKQAEILDYNAHVADVQAADAIDRGAQEESKFRQGVKALVGSQRAGFAGAGVDVGYGSAVDVQGDAAYLSEIDAAQIKQNAQREAWGFKVQSVELTKRAGVTRMEGAMQAQAGEVAQSTARIGAVGGLVTTGGSLLMQKYGFKKEND
jgi:hypothetical protein